MPNAATPVNIAVYAGQILVGVFPALLGRPDAAPVCGAGAGAHGFGVGFTQPVQAAFAGQTSLSLYAYTSDFPATLLPPSSRLTANSHALPSGALAGIDTNGIVSGTVASTLAHPPIVAVYGGAPIGQGGVSLGSPVVAALDNATYGFTLPAGGLNWQGRPDAANVPVYGYVEDTTGNLVPLMGPTYAAPNGLSTMQVIVARTVTQSGALSGIRNTMFTTWLPPHVAVGALSGTVSLAGNDTSFSEALVLVGTTNDAQAACTAKNEISTAGLPPMQRIWAGILKRNGSGTAALPVNFALPYGVTPVGSAAGTCLLTAVSAGYPFLDNTHARYTRTSVQLTTTFNQAPQAAPSIVPLGLGGEFRFDTRASNGLYAYVGIVASKTLVVDGIAGSVSVAPVAGAPGGSSWLPNPGSAWSVDTTFDYLPQPACQKAGFTRQPSNGMFSIMRVATPTPVPLAAGARPVLDMPLSGSGTTAVQLAPFQAFTSTAPGAGATLTLNPGDCLIALVHSSRPGSAAGGMLDYENQSTVYLRPTP